MASCCNLTGVIGVRNGRSFSYSPKKNFWKHDGFLPLDADDQPVELFTFGGGSSAPLDDGVYFGVARVITCMTAGADTATTEPVLQLFANEEFAIVPAEERMPAPIFVVVGKVARTNLDVDQKRAFDIDVSQYGAVAQQLIRLRCFYPSENTRFRNTPLPTIGKHVVVHGHLSGFMSGRCLIHVVDITLGPGDLSGPSQESVPSTKLGGFDWKGRKEKRARIEDDFKEEDEVATQPSPASGSQSVLSGLEA